MSNGLEGSKYLGQALRIWDVELLNFSLFLFQGVASVSVWTSSCFLFRFFFSDILWNLTTQSVVTRSAVLAVLGAF